MPTLIDRRHLDSQTFGDTELASELLQLFAEQCRRLLPGIVDTTLPVQERADLAHTLKGSALGVGAEKVAVLSAEIEDGLRLGEAVRAERLNKLDAAVAATVSEIAAAT